ncbi:MAG: hypothetical protein K8T91_20920 [Planctomycetes bacterium]|nr:hypothetical protein [Planctomycetota bacterium]
MQSPAERNESNNMQPDDVWEAVHGEPLLNANVHCSGCGRINQANSKDHLPLPRLRDTFAEPGGGDGATTRLGEGFYGGRYPGRR